MPPELFDSIAVAKMLHCNRTTVYNLAKARKLDVIVMGRKRWFTQEGVDKFIQDNTLPAQVSKLPELRKEQNSTEQKNVL